MEFASALQTGAHDALRRCHDKLLRRATEAEAALCAEREARSKLQQSYDRLHCSGLMAARQETLHDEVQAVARRGRATFQTRFVNSASG